MKQSYFKTGSIVFGHFIILERIGEGGMGVVYKTRNRSLDRLMALKVLTSEFADRDLVRFQNEARILSKLDHSNVARVFDFGYEDGIPYLAMDFAEGPSLQKILDSKKMLALSEFLPVFRQVCLGLSHAHGKSIVHRDIKPSNVILSKDESGKPRVVIVDFGIAKIEDEESARLTQTGGFIGSPFYASPEQSRGLPTSSQSDLYSLGCMMFHALTGAPPFQGENALATVLLHQQEEPPLEKLSERDPPVELIDLIAALLAKQPQDRPDGVEKVIEALIQMDSGETAEVAGDELEDPESERQIDLLFTSYSALQSNESSRRVGMLVVIIIALSLLSGAAVLFSPSLYDHSSLAPVKGDDGEHLVPDGEPLFDKETAHKKGASGRFDGLSIKNSNKLDLSFKKEMDDEKIRAAIGDRTDIELLNLYGTGARSLSYVKNLKKLRSLNVGATEIEDASIDNLVLLKNLEVLNISRTGIGDAGLRKLVSIGSLRHLDATRCSYLTDSALSDFIMLMPECRLTNLRQYSQILMTSAKTLSKRGDLKESLNLYDKALAEIKRESPAKLHPYYVQAQMGKHRTLLALKREPDAKRVMAGLMATKLDSRDTSRLATYLLDNPAREFRNGRTKEAIREGTALAETFDRSVQKGTLGAALIWSCVGSWCINTGSPEKGLDLTNKAIRILLNHRNDPLYGSTLLSRGCARVKLKDGERARQDFIAGEKKLADLNKQSEYVDALITAKLYRSELELAEGNWKEALEQMKLARQINLNYGGSNRTFELLIATRIKEIEARMKAHDGNS